MSFGPHRRRAGFITGLAALLVATALSMISSARAEPAHPNIGAAGSTSSRILTIRYPSQVLDRDEEFTVIRPSHPAGCGGAVLFLLHGRGRNDHSLVDRAASRAALLSAPFFIVLPNGHDGWYIDSPAKPADRYQELLEEQIQQAEMRFPLSRDAHRRAICGWSMGGYGAVHFAESHAGEFAVVASIIGLLDFPRPATLPSGQNYRVPVDRFGSDPAEWRLFNPLNGVAKLLGSDVLLVTASRSFDRTMNGNFLVAAQKAGLDCTFETPPGAHTIEVVEAALPRVLRFTAQRIMPRGKSA